MEPHVTRETAVTKILLNKQTKDGVFWLKYPLLLKESKENEYLISSSCFNKKTFYTLKDLAYLMAKKNTDSIDCLEWRYLNSLFEQNNSDLIGLELNSKKESLCVSTIIDTYLRKINYYSL